MSNFKNNKFIKNQDYYFIIKMAIFNLNVKKKSNSYVEDMEEEYLSIPEESEVIKTENISKDVEVRVFVLDDYDSIRDILDIIRGEKTMCLIDIHLLRNKDADELKRAVDKLKKTIAAVNGELVGFHENWILAAPANVHVHKGKN